MNIVTTASLGKKNVQSFNLGQIGCFVDKDYSQQGVKPLNSQMLIWARLVRNESGGNLTAGSIVTDDTGSTYGPGKAVGAAAVSGTSIGVGVVDPFVSGNIAAGETFWLIEAGPCQFKFTTGTTIAPGDAAALGAAGRVIQLDHTTLTDQLIFDRCGTVLEDVLTGVASDTLFRGIAEFRRR